MRQSPWSSRSSPSKCCRHRNEGGTSQILTRNHSPEHSRISLYSRSPECYLDRNVALPLLIESGCPLQTRKPPHVRLDRGDLSARIHFGGAHHWVPKAHGDTPTVPPLVLKTHRHDRHARDAILLRERHEAEEARLKREERAIVGLGGEAGIDIGVALGEDQEKLSATQQPYTLARSREQLSL